MEITNILNTAKDYGIPVIRTESHNFLQQCIKSEKQLYTDFETFTSKLEKEIEKAHN